MPGIRDGYLRTMGGMSARDVHPRQMSLAVSDITASGSDTDEELDEEVDAPATELDEDTFGMSIAAIARDNYFMATGKGQPMNRLARTLTTFFLLLLCLGMQIFLLANVKQFVSAKFVHDIRETYDVFELAMYDTTYTTINGKHRGTGPMRTSNFFTMSEEDQQNACRIPLSQPSFFMAVLLIWTVTCASELRRSLFLLHRITWETPRLDTMEDSLKEDRNEDGVYLIEGLTLATKAVVGMFVILPRICITLYLCWVGCRWLLATTNFADLILNAVALEFILVLKELLYVALVPERNKRDLMNTKVAPRRDAHGRPVQEAASIKVFVGTLGWLVLSIGWVVAYIGIPQTMSGLQQVLPHYQWDVHDVCEPWVWWRYCVTPPCPSSVMDAYNKMNPEATLSTTLAP